MAELKWAVKIVIINIHDSYPVIIARSVVLPIFVLNFVTKIVLFQVITKLNFNF